MWGFVLQQIYEQICMSPSAKQLFELVTVDSVTRLRTVPSRRVSPKTCASSCTHVTRGSPQPGEHQVVTCHRYLTAININIQVFRNFNICVIYYTDSISRYLRAGTLSGENCLPCWHWNICHCSLLSVLLCSPLCSDVTVVCYWSDRSCVICYVRLASCPFTYM